MKLNKTYN